MRLSLRVIFVLILLLASAASRIASAQQPVPVAIVGLTHGHVQGFLRELPRHADVRLVGIAEPDASLRAKYEALLHLDHAMFFASEEEMLRATKPHAILVYTSPALHRAVIEKAAPLHVSAMVEKPLATTVEDALAIERLAHQYNVAVLTNYETTWYASNTAAMELTHSGKLGEVRRVVFHDGHKGPKEIGVDPEFLGFLTDAKQNGGGALFDFGCYGADLVTVLMHGRLPLSVTAITQTDKPSTYPHVDDDSTILLQYPGAVADIEGSWNWPFDRKDMEIYGSTGTVFTVKSDSLRVRLPGEAAERTETAPALPVAQASSLSYLVSVLRGAKETEHDLTALDTNVIVVRILDAARTSAASAQTVRLSER